MRAGLQGAAPGAAAALRPGAEPGLTRVLHEERAAQRALQGAPLKQAKHVRSVSEAGGVQRGRSKGVRPPPARPNNICLPIFAPPQCISWGMAGTDLRG